MSGIYVHIPFCNKFCPYCDFYKSANYRYEHDFVKAILIEIEKRKDFFYQHPSTIYFGGGTPSSIKLVNLEAIIKQLGNYFDLSFIKEFAIELNPEDVTKDFCKTLIEFGFNRVSLGIQSFNNNILKFLGRNHSGPVAKEAINILQSVGIKNINIDLIYGIPNQIITDFANDLEIFKKFNLAHLSAYHLGIVEGTQFGRSLKSEIFKEMDDNQSFQFYHYLTGKMKEWNYVHYEISNFSLPGYQSKHNLMYWDNLPYLGLGSSAHSYNLHSRFWNIKPVQIYNHAILNNNLWYELEDLSKKDLFNEYILKTLRTNKGISLNYILKNFELEYYDYILRIYNELKNIKGIRMVQEHIILDEMVLLNSDYYIRRFIKL